MAKPNYSYEKRQRELAKKKKKEDKEKEKAERKHAAENPSGSADGAVDSESADGDAAEASD